MNNGRVLLVSAISIALAEVLLLTACSTQNGNIALGAAGITAFVARAPNNEIEVIYYLGVFDPKDQLPPTVYRVRVHGQASMISLAKFASGWVRAELIDSLNTGGNFSNGNITIDKSTSLENSGFETGRRLMMFGPEGFREAPKDHRLVIVMGSDPSAFFQAMDQSLGVVTDAQATKQNSDLVNKLFLALAKLKGESDRLGDLSKNVASTFPASQ